MIGGRIAIVVVAVLAVFRQSGRADACSFPSPTTHVIVPEMQATDHVAPTLRPLPAATIKRAAGTTSSACGGMVSSCDDIGVITLTLSATDDMTPPDRIGYRFTVVSGSPPFGLTIRSDTVDPPAPGSISFVWIDGGMDGQEPVDFTVQVVAVDQAGNESAPQTLRIDDGAGGCGCRTSSGRGGAAAVLGLALVLAARRRRCIRNVSGTFLRG